MTWKQEAWVLVLSLCDLERVTSHLGLGILSGQDPGWSILFPSCRATPSSLAPDNQQRPRSLCVRASLVMNIRG